MDHITCLVPDLALVDFRVCGIQPYPASGLRTILRVRRKDAWDRQDQEQAHDDARARDLEVPTGCHQVLDYQRDIKRYQIDREG